MLKSPIVITGYGILSALGRGADALTEAFKANRSGIEPIRFLDTTLTHIKVGEVKQSTVSLADELGVSDQSARLRTVVIGVAALRDALQMASLSADSLRDVDFISGTTVGGMDNTEKFFNRLAACEGKGSDADQLAFNDCGASTRLIANETGDFHSITTISTACSSAANAIALAAEMIESGRAECVVAGGSESLSKFHLNGFNSLMILSADRCRPFNADRDGINLGEGAAYLVMESLDHALARGATPLAVLSGWGNACDAYHQTASSPSGEGPARSMKAALKRARLQPSDINYINAHGTGTENNDSSELAAMHATFGPKLPCYSSTKPFTGHTTSSAGVIEAVVAIEAIRKGVIPANLGLTKPVEPENPPVEQTVEGSGINHVLTNSFGFGGNDSTLIFSRFANNHVADGASAARRRVFVDGASMISCCGAMTDDWLSASPQPSTEYKRAVEPDVKGLLSPGEARRMSRILKRALASSLSIVDKESLPEAIITATGLGCMENSEKFLNELYTYGEEMLKPTLFMQSTHNTIGSQIAISLGCHCYNTTYSHKSISWESALADAVNQIQTGQIDSALVGAHDETTPITAGASMTANPDSGFISEGSVAALISATADSSQSRPVEIVEVTTLYKPSVSELHNIISRLNPDALMLGLTGHSDNDRHYKYLIDQSASSAYILAWKPMLGRHFAASAQAFFAACKFLQSGSVADNYVWRKGVGPINTILIINHADGLEWGLTLLTVKS